MTKSMAAIAVAAIALASCGGRVALAPKDGRSMPQKAETAAAVPTADELIKPDTQARPDRSDEQLRRSEQRQDDKFDSPPTH